MAFEGKKSFHFWALLCIFVLPLSVHVYGVEETCSKDMKEGGVPLIAQLLKKTAQIENKCNADIGSLRTDLDRFEQEVYRLTNQIGTQNPTTPKPAPTGTQKPTTPKPASTGNNVAFYARLLDSSAGPGVTDTEIVIFNQVKLNIGDGYDASTGKFMAPVAGLYTFFWAGYVEVPAWPLNAALYHNQKAVVGSYEVPGVRSTTGNMAIIQLAKDDEVYVVVRIHSHMWSSGRGLCIFLGNMLKEDTTVAFALRGSSLGPFDQDETIIYDKVSINNGDLYNQQTGIFTPSIRGAYMIFWASTSESAEYTSDTVLYRNGEPILGAKEGEISKSTLAAKSIILELTEQDSVQIKLLAGGQIQNPEAKYNSSTSSFTVQLLFGLDSQQPIHPSKVAFSLMHTSDINPSGIILFDKVITDTANAYYIQSGMFLTPVAGTYKFFYGGYIAFNDITLHVKTGTANYIWQPDGWFSTVSNMAIVTIPANTPVSVRARARGDNRGINSTFTFSGFLLF